MWIYAVLLEARKAAMSASAMIESLLSYTGSSISVSISIPLMLLFENTERAIASAGQLRYGKGYVYEKEAKEPEFLSEELK